MAHFVLVAAVVFVSYLCPAFAEDKAPNRPIPRTELVPLTSLTISDEQFLKGDTNGKAVTIAAEFRIARPTGQQPVVVLMHGSGGIGSNISMWVDELNGLGISTFVIDGFTGRGLQGTNTNQALLGRLNFVLDIYRVLEVLAKHPRVDAQRLALMGFSRGGQAALYASVKRFHQLWNKSGIDFAAYLPFYPDCATTYVEDTVISSSHVRIFGGTVDDYNPLAKCKAYAERLKVAGREIEITEYPNAQHAFDSPLLPTTPIVAKDNQTVRNCTIREDPRGVLINAQTGQVFSYADPCVERNPHVGFDPEATTHARAAVGTFLKNAFKIE
jgi:dienelactone hydrolase